MNKADVCYLLVENTNTRGVYNNQTANERMVYCNVRSVGMSESYAAMSNGFFPEYRIELTLAEDYNGERFCRYAGTVYMIIRVYHNDNGGVELTLQRGYWNGRTP